MSVIDDFSDRFYTRLIKKTEVLAVLCNEFGCVLDGDQDMSADMVHKEYFYAIVSWLFSNKDDIFEELPKVNNLSIRYAKGWIDAELSVVFSISRDENSDITIVFKRLALHPLAYFEFDIRTDEVSSLINSFKKEEFDIDSVKCFCGFKNNPDYSVEYVCQGKFIPTDNRVLLKTEKVLNTFSQMTNNKVVEFNERLFAGK